MKLAPFIVIRGIMNRPTASEANGEPITTEQGHYDSAAIIPAGRINKSSKTDRQWLDETCLDARDVPGLTRVKLDPRSWHPDNWSDDYGEHLRFTLYDKDDNVIDICHVYEEMTDSNCLVTFCRKNYGGHGIPKGDGYYAYLSDTHPG
jgi:hypothetical protein